MVKFRCTEIGLFMLNKSYNKGIIGLNYVSLIFGLISLDKGDSALIIDDQELPFSNKWYLNIGYLERSLLILLGEKYNIEPLRNLDNYLKDQSTVLCLNEKIIELVNSPFSNIKEIARKIPSCFSKVYLDNLSQVNPEVFDQDFLDYLDKVCVKAFKHLDLGEADLLFDEHKGLELENVMSSFIEFFEGNTDLTKQIHYILQVMYQTVFSSGYLDLESHYLLLSLLSPRYEVNNLKLKEDLLVDYRIAGGDIKFTTVKDWGVEEKCLKYLLLDSIDGLIKVDHTYFFSQINHHLPFEIQTGKTQFKSIEIKCMLDHKFIKLYENKRIIFSKKSRMGSDFPYWEFSIDEQGLLSGLYSYADYTGTKPSFYYHHAVEDIYNSITSMLPGLVKADWVSRVKLSPGQDSWVEFAASDKQSLSPVNSLQTDFIYSKANRKPIECLHQCGPDRGKSLGFFSYLMDVFS